MEVASIFSFRLPTPFLGELARAALVSVSVATPALVAYGGLCQAFVEPPAKLLPVDEGNVDPEFVEFRQRLLKASESGNIAAVLAATSTDVQVHLEKPERGIDELRKEWTIDKSPQPFLDELAEVLRLGGSMTEGNTAFVAPYVWTGFPNVPPGFLPDYAVVVRPNAPLRRKPRSDATIVPAFPTMSSPLLQRECQDGSR